MKQRDGNITPTAENTMNTKQLNDLNRDLNKYNTRYTALHAQLYARLNAGESMANPQVNELSRQVENTGWTLDDITLTLNNLDNF